MTSPEQEPEQFVAPENPLIDGDTEYSVRLVFRVSANDPEHARTRFIALLNEFGMNAWTYRITETEGEERDFLVKDGEVLTPEEFAEREDEQEAVEAFLRTEGYLDDGDDDGDGDIETVVDADARV